MAKRVFTYSGRMKISRGDMALLKAGKKSVTVRLGTASVNGNQITMTDGKESVRVHILHVDTARTLGQLTDVDAFREGFGSKQELLDDLKKYYPTAGPTDLVTVISFSPVVPQTMGSQASLF
jgi:hypothetical protein